MPREPSLPPDPDARDAALVQSALLSHARPRRCIRLVRHVLRRFWRWC
jgi:hypothetical protein